MRKAIIDYNSKLENTNGVKLFGHDLMMAVEAPRAILWKIRFISLYSLQSNVARTENVRGVCLVMRDDKVIAVEESPTFFGLDASFWIVQKQVSMILACEQSCKKL